MLGAENSRLQAPAEDDLVRLFAGDRQIEETETNTRSCEHPRARTTTPCDNSQRNGHCATEKD